jgi:SNF2 family DNA or RNA helicase
MIEHPPSGPIGDVRTTDLLDRLLITPRRLAEGHRLSSAVREALPGLRVHRSAEGLWVAAHDADVLLKAPLQLRWHPEAQQFVENRARVKQVFGHVHEAVKRIVHGGRKEADRHLDGIAGLDVLDDHQRVNVAAMTVPEGFGLCVFDEQGAGKTVSLIYAFDLLVSRDEADFALIVAPKSMVAEWPHDFHRFKGDLYSVSVASGHRRHKLGALRPGSDVLVTNFETAVSMEDELRVLLKHHEGRAVLVIDESFHVKNLDTKRTQALRRLREWCGRAYVLCGTPAPNTPHDLIQQFNIVDFGIAFSGLRIPEDRQQAVRPIKEAMEYRGLFVRHLKSEVMPDLPAKRFQRLLLPLQPVQAKLYMAALKNLVSDLKSVNDATFKKQIGSFLARRSALLQICSNPCSVADRYTETPAKLLALDDLLNELVRRRREKVVVWSFYTASLDAIAGRYKGYGTVRYDGTVDDIAARREAVRKFQEDDETMVFVANPAAAGAGLTLHRARVALFESMSNQGAHYLQSLDRIHRRGQTRGVDCIILLCDGPIELNEYDHLVQKERTARSVLGDPADQTVTRTAMLAELEAASHLPRESQ